jgi:hypothetical protein
MLTVPARKNDGSAKYVSNSLASQHLLTLRWGQASLVLITLFLFNVTVAVSSLGRNPVLF